MALHDSYYIIGKALLHKGVHKRAAADRKKSMEAHNTPTKIILPRFSIGDFVLVRTATNLGHKWAFKWVGPRRITKVVSHDVYAVKRLSQRRIETVLLGNNIESALAKEAAKQLGYSSWAVAYYQQERHQLMWLRRPWLSCTRINAASIAMPRWYRTLNKC